MSRRILIAISILALTACIGFAIAHQQLTAAEQRRAASRVQLYRSTLLGTLERFQHLPLILRSDPFVEAALVGGDLDRLNLRLEAFAEASELEAIYLLDRSGLTIAASNFRSELSFVGRNYGFRPYFREALGLGRGEFYAIGATTSRPGYFIAASVGGEARPAGVLAVKVGLNPLQEDWRRGGETVFVSNADGVIVLASNPDWLYRTLSALTPERRASIEAEKQFADEPLRGFGWRSDSAGFAEADGVAYLHAAAAINRLGWRIHYLTERAPVSARAALAGGAAAAIASLILSLMLFVRSERLREALRTSQAQRRELREANLEIERTSKLVALGQLSASVAHELGQPLSAIRNYLAVIELSEAAAALRDPLAKMRGVSDRMERLIRELRQFARPSRAASDRVDLHRVIEGACELLSHDFAEAGARLQVAPGSVETCVAGDAMALEQALVNLLRNALLAVEDRADGRVSLSVRMSEGAVEIVVADNGPGIGSETIDRLTEPFHTTRASGEGMGLGLAIVAGIVKEHGGSLAAENRSEGGAAFTIRLPNSAGEKGETG